MLHFNTVQHDTLELLKTLQGMPELSQTRLVGGTKKDFVDLFFLLNTFSLDEMLDLYKQKYASGSIFNVVRSLSYFNDADAEPMPKMLIPYDWTETKNTIVQAIQHLSKKKQPKL